MDDHDEIAQAFLESFDTATIEAAKGHLAAGRPIYYGGDPNYPGQIIREYPDGKREIVDCTTDGDIFAIMMIPSVVPFDKR